MISRVAHVNSLLGSWCAGGLAYGLAARGLPSPGWRLTARAFVALVVITTLVYQPIMGWLRRRGDGVTADGSASPVSFALLGAAMYPLPLLFAFPDAIVAILIPNGTIVPYVIAAAVSGATYGLAFAILTRRPPRNELR